MRIDGDLRHVFVAAFGRQFPFGAHRIAPYGRIDTQRPVNKGEMIGGIAGQCEGQIFIGAFCFRHPIRRAEKRQETIAFRRNSERQIRRQDTYCGDFRRNTYPVAVFAPKAAYMLQPDEAGELLRRCADHGPELPLECAYAHPDAAGNGCDGMPAVRGADHTCRRLNLRRDSLLQGAIAGKDPGCKKALHGCDLLSHLASIGDGVLHILDCLPTQKCVDRIPIAAIPVDCRSRGSRAEKPVTAQNPMTDEKHPLLGERYSFTVSRWSNPFYNMVGVCCPFNSENFRVVRNATTTTLPASGVEIGEPGACSMLVGVTV